MAEIVATNQSLDATSTEGLFRSVKRRRHYRRRSDADEVDVKGDASQTPAVPIESDTIGRSQDSAVPHAPDAGAGDEDEQLSVAEALRRRKQLRARRGGVEFVPGRPNPKDGDLEMDSSRMALEKTAPAEEVAAIVNRFAPQTGQVADVNKHMMAYIDSELDKLHQGPTDDTASRQGTVLSGDVHQVIVRGGHIQRQPATLGKLHEIDLGPDSKRKNIERTEAAKKRVEGDDDDEALEDGSKPRLGKDGKPWRGRKRRTSEDIRRDKLVEEVLRESKIELYDEPVAEKQGDDSQAADDRIAEQFRRDFLDAISNRHRRRFGGGNKSAAAKAKKDERPKGPKLGGSRSARAAMREQQVKAGKR